MIQAITETSMDFFLTTEDNRINTSVSSDNIWHLFKFTNDMDKKVTYVYPEENSIYVTGRVTGFRFVYNVIEDMFNGHINFLPAGYYKYEVYEVSWVTPGGFFLSSGYAPVTELDVLEPPANDKGIVQGLVTKGIMNLTEKSGTEQVQYIQNAKSVQTLTISYGGAGYAIAPTITITGSNITQATATCTVLAGVVNTVTITNAGSGYTTNPSVTVTGGGATDDAQIIADIAQTNYIYYGQ